MQFIKIGLKSETSKEIALKTASKLIQTLNPKRAAIAGSFLRGHLLGNDLDLVMILNKKPQLEKEYPLAINLFLTDEDSFEACVLHYAIGKAIIRLKSKAKSLGMKLDQSGLYKDNVRIANKVVDIYSKLGLKAPFWLLECFNDKTGLYCRDKSKY